jgi:hypothetical protein
MAVQGRSIFPGVSAPGDYACGMGTTPVDEYEEAVFATPFAYTGTAVMTRSYSVLVAAVFAILLCKGGNHPSIQIMLGICILTFLFLGLWRLGPNIHRRIILRSDGIWIGGLTCDARVPYESVRLVRVEGGLRKDDQLILEWGSKGKASLLLRRSDADRCFRALLDRCGLAAGVGAGGDIYEPIEADPGEPGRDVVAELLRKKARGALLGAWFALTIWIGVMISIGAHRLTIIGNPLVWLMAGVLPIGAALAFLAARRHRQTLREYEGRKSPTGR